MTYSEADELAPPAAEGLPRKGRRLAVLSGGAALGLPSGWFVVATSEELRAGERLTTTFMSEELVLYRTASGEARAISPHCPHLGAHLGHCGTVVGENIRCDFHRFTFDGSGACVKNGYGTRPPPAARLGVRHVREQHGIILVFHDHAGQPPSWEVPLLDTTRWSAPVYRKLSLRGHPQETSENSVDTGHFAAVHGYEDVREVHPARVEGPRLFARYAMKRRFGPPALGVVAATEFDVMVHGLGYSAVEVDVVSHGFRTRQFVFSTPTTPGHIDLRLGVSVQEPWSDRGLTGLLPRRRIADAIARWLIGPYERDVRQDFHIWEHKRYVPQPALAAGDGPVGLYRKWASQFYSEGRVGG